MNAHDDLKQEYLKMFDGNSNLQGVTRSRLDKISEYETIIGKDMLNWSEKDFESFLKFVKYKNFNSLSSFRSAITRYGRFLCDSLGIHDCEFVKMSEQFSGDKLHDMIVIEGNDNTIITCYDYEDIINNNVDGVKLYPIEQIMFIIFWHNIVAVPNDIFELPMDRIDFENKTISRFNGEVVQLSDAEINIIRKFKDDQCTPVEIQRAKKDAVFCGIIEIDEHIPSQMDALLTIPHSDNLFHPVLGNSFERAGVGKVSLVMKAPVIVRFGKNKILEITKHLGNKLGMDFKPLSIVRSGVYYRKIKERNIDITNVNAKSITTMFSGEKGSKSYTREELLYIIERMTERELRDEFEKNML